MTQTLYVQRIYALYDHIDQCQKTNYYTPGIFEIGATFKISYRTARKLLTDMKVMGMIEPMGKGWQNIRLLQREPNWNALVTPEPGEYPPIKVQTVDRTKGMRTYRSERLPRR